VAAKICFQVKFADISVAWVGTIVWATVFSVRLIAICCIHHSTTEKLQQNKSRWTALTHTPRIKNCYSHFHNNFYKYAWISILIVVGTCPRPCVSRLASQGPRLAAGTTRLPRPCEPGFAAYNLVFMICGAQLSKWILIILVFYLLRCMPCTSLTWWHNWNHIVHRALYHAAERDAKSLSLQRCSHPIRQIWIRWTTESAVAFSRGSTVHRSMMWRTWKNVCWASGGCWTTPSSLQQLRSGVVIWMHVFAWMVDIFKINFEPLTLLCFVCFINTISPKCDRYKHVQITDIVWNVLLLCIKLSHGMVATKRICDRKFSCQLLWHSLVKFCTKSYENPSIFVQVTAKKTMAPFFMWRQCM